RDSEAAREKLSLSIHAVLSSFLDKTAFLYAYINQLGGIMMGTTFNKNQYVDEVIKAATDDLTVDKAMFMERANRIMEQEVEDVTTELIKVALENIDEANPDWTYVASRMY